MALSVRAAPPNSVVLLEDPVGGDVPESIRGAALIAATPSCIAVGCRAEVDGDTEFTLGPGQEVDPGYSPAFDGTLETPSRVLAIRSVLGEIILKVAVPQQRTRILVWTNDATAPNEVIVGVQ